MSFRARHLLAGGSRSILILRQVSNTPFWQTMHLGFFKQHQQQFKMSMHPCTIKSAQFRVVRFLQAAELLRAWLLLLQVLSSLFAVRIASYCDLGPPSNVPFQLRHLAPKKFDAVGLPSLRHVVASCRDCQYSSLSFGCFLRFVEIHKCMSCNCNCRRELREVCFSLRVVRK